ncbi:MAG: OmpA family protein [Proteobacteria bacterium]|nr:OmpA family protein [Pseudomonadota bacterium]
MDARFTQFEILTALGALVVCLLFLSIALEASDIEDDVGARVRQAIGEQDLFWVSVEPNGQSVVLTGAAPNARARDKAQTVAAATGGVTDVENDIQIVGQAGTCQQNFDRYLADEKVTFKTGRADLAESSYPLLEMLASIARSCRATLEIAAHTDGRGDAAINLKLSQRRADAVRKYLVGSGVEAQHLKATGYGENQPIADNNSEEGRSANRRVEFRVIGEQV